MPAKYCLLPARWIKYALLDSKTLVLAQKQHCWTTGWVGSEARVVAEGDERQEGRERKKSTGGKTKTKQTKVETSEDFFLFSFLLGSPQAFPLHFLIDSFLPSLFSHSSALAFSLF